MPPDLFSARVEWHLLPHFVFSCTGFQLNTGSISKFVYWFTSRFIIWPPPTYLECSIDDKIPLIVFDLILQILLTWWSLVPGVRVLGIVAFLCVGPGFGMRFLLLLNSVHRLASLSKDSKHICSIVLFMNLYRLQSLYFCSFVSHLFFVKYNFA